MACVPYLQLKASKPEWKAGSSFKLRIAPATATTAVASITPSDGNSSAQNGAAASQPSAVPLPEPATWRISTGGAMDEDLIDEDSLLGPEDMAAAPAPVRAPTGEQAG